FHLFGSCFLFVGLLHKSGTFLKLPRVKRKRSRVTRGLYSLFGSIGIPEPRKANKSSACVFLYGLNSVSNP
ncbi:hypothetical protein, partial [uncultured Alistipes sp.]|uniref:hypothetical protein n=1 Tax=uncultured Alistipes sp. TaxID=538949 RepID=UPI00261174BF